MITAVALQVRLKAIVPLGIALIVLGGKYSNTIVQLMSFSFISANFARTLLEIEKSGASWPADFV